MVRKMILPIFLVLMVSLASQAVSDMMPVSQHYLTDEYVTIRDFHKHIALLIKKNPDDKALELYALRVMEGDLAAVENLDPPEDFIEMKDYMVEGLKQHTIALQLYLKGETKAAEKEWKSGDAQFQWVDAFLVERDWVIDSPPTLDPNYKPTDIPLTAEQYADRYFLLRMLNDPDIDTKGVQGKKSTASLDRLERRLMSEQIMWKAMKFPQQMQDIHIQIGLAINMSLGWVKAVRAGKMDEALKMQGKIQDFYKKINSELTQDFKIEIPDYVQIPG